MRKTMRARVWATAAVGAALVGLSGGTSGQAAGGAGLCLAGETPVLSCTVGKRVLSLCGTGITGAVPSPSATLQYRFGRKGAVEMRYPSSPTPPGDLFRLSTTMFAGGGEERIRFSSGAYDYLVFQRDIAGEWNEDGTRDHFQDEGVVVERAGKVLAVHTCTGDLVNGGYPKMYDLLQREERGALDIPCCGDE